MDPSKTIPAGKFQIIQQEFNKDVLRRVNKLEEDANKESDDQRKIDKKVEVLETKVAIQAKIIWLLITACSGLLGNLVYHLLTKK